MGHSSIQITFDTYGHLFPRQGAETSARYEKSMEAARVKSGPDVSKALAMEGEANDQGDATN
jgi:hypothetical protein